MYKELQNACDIYKKLEIFKIQYKSISIYKIFKIQYIYYDI